MPILIAVNPYKNLDIYNDEFIRSFKQHFHHLKTNPNEVGPAVPHLFYIAEAAYQDMINEKKNQSVIISGESGSGKTQSTKIILKFLAVSSLHSVNLDSKSTSQSGVDPNIVTVEKQVLDSNPLLEAFGNAKTVKNNNSSRFGKFIQVNFTDHGKILSARIYNYLLEKSRVVGIQPEERNYHIFYQLILGADEKERKKHHIKDLDYFQFLNQGCYDVDEIDDKANFLETKECMSKLKFSSAEISYTFDLLMGILYLGNIEFIEESKNGNTIAVIAPESMMDFKFASELLGFEQNTLRSILTIRKMKDPMSHKIFERNLSPEKAYKCRDAIAKTVYARMFDYIVKKVNIAIANTEEMNKQEKSKMRKIGLLDIFGFENFGTNSFEQLCINYANERLQQFFNNHIFKLEQEEYKKEGIDWSQVDFVDNKDILELIDETKLSIFTILDSEGITPNATDESFKSKVYHHLSKNPSLGQEEEEHLSVNHYAGIVYYYIYGFIEKNIDQLTPDILEALEVSKNKLVKKIFEKKEGGSSKSKKSTLQNAPNKLQSDSLSKQFKSQLDELMQMLSQSNPRYVKCIKPNSVKKPLILDSFDVMDQLLSAGVLEAIKIRKQGYSIRRTQEEFIRRYLPLCPQIDINSLEINSNFQEGTYEMLKILEGNVDIRSYLDAQKKLIQVGTTKVFMKEEVKNILESKLNRIKYIYRIQSKFRAWKVYKKIRKYLYSIKKIQSRWRGMETRIFVSMLRLTIKIQKFVRFSLKKKKIFRNLHKLANENIKRKKKEEEEERRRKQKEMEELEKLENQKMAHLSTPTQSNTTQNNESENIQAVNNHQSFEENETIHKTKNKKNNKHNTIKADRFSTVSHKDSQGDVSHSDLQLCNDLKSAIKKQTGNKKTSKNHFQEIFQSNLESVLDMELRSKLEAVTNELEQTRKDKEYLTNELSQHKEEIKSKEKEIQNLKTQAETNTFKAQIDQINLDMSLTKKSFLLEKDFQCDHPEEIKKLKKEISESEGYVDVLNLKIEELKKSNENLLFLNEGLEEQLQKRKEKMDKEMMSLYQQIKEIEIKKNEYERSNKILLENEKRLEMELNQKQNQKTSASDSKTISDLKSENRNNNKKLEELKTKHEKEIQNYKNDINVKDIKIKENESVLIRLDKELKEKNESYNNTKIEYEICKEKIQDLKLKLEELNKSSKLIEYEQEINKMKIEFENNVKKKDTELKELQENLENFSSQMERLRKMEKALKNELQSKDQELTKRQEVLRQSRTENDKLADENLILKKENFNLNSKYEMLEIEYRNKVDVEFKKKTQELKSMKEKETKYEKIVADLKDTLKNKQKIIENKKKMNLMLVDLAKIKKGEVQCLETLHYTNSTNLKETLTKIRENERTLLSK